MKNKRFEKLLYQVLGNATGLGKTPCGIAIRLLKLLLFRSRIDWSLSKLVASLH